MSIETFLSRFVWSTSNLYQCEIATIVVSCTSVTNSCENVCVQMFTFRQHDASKNWVSQSDFPFSLSLCVCATRYLMSMQQQAHVSVQKRLCLCKSKRMCLCSHFGYMWNHVLKSHNLMHNSRKPRQHEYTAKTNWKCLFSLCLKDQTISNNKFRTYAVTKSRHRPSWNILCNASLGSLMQYSC